MCQHDLAEREAAAFDGYCPLCLAAENERLRKALSTAEFAIRFYQQERAALRAEHDRLQGALEKILSFTDPGGVDACHEVARAALQSKGE